jgi:integral membrane protein (TIGR01906 family)
MSETISSVSSTPATDRPLWATAARVVVMVLMPVVLVLTNVRLLLTPASVQLEYRMPGFPPEAYGFTREDRLHWAPLALEYLLNDAGREFLGDLRFDSGAPVYNERELRHMEDVKRLTQAALKVWIAGVVVVGVTLAGMLLARRGNDARSALLAGSRLTLVLMAILGVGLVVGFGFVFVGFHRVFFEGDTWMFLYSDTLIRLFPERFWQDVFAFIAGGTLVETGAIYLAARRRPARPQE